jgi:hypothetical protein
VKGNRQFGQPGERNAVMKFNHRHFVQGLMSATALSLALLPAGSTSAYAGSVSVTGPNGAGAFFAPLHSILLGEIAAGSQSITIDFLLSYENNTSLTPDASFGFTYALVDPPLAATPLSAAIVPEPSTWAMMLIGFAGPRVRRLPGSRQNLRTCSDRRIRNDRHLKRPRSAIDAVRGESPNCGWLSPPTGAPAVISSREPKRRLICAFCNDRFAVHSCHSSLHAESPDSALERNRWRGSGGWMV